VGKWVVGEGSYYSEDKERWKEEEGEGRGSSSYDQSECRMRGVLDEERGCGGSVGMRRRGSEHGLQLLVQVKQG